MVTIYRICIDTKNSETRREHQFAAFTKDIGEAMELFIEQQRTLTRKTPVILSITRLESYDLLKEGAF